MVKISYYGNKNFKGTIITKSLIIRNVVVAGNSAENASQYGYCAICGVALTYEEANNEFIQSKVCYNCANNPYYQHCEADYANKKLYEKYPKDHECTMKMIGVIMMTIIDFFLLLRHDHDENYNWINFYMEFADNLLKYKNNRKILIDKIQKVFNNLYINMGILKWDIDRNLIVSYDIDPFTIFSLFNKQISNKKHIKIIKEFFYFSECPTETVNLLDFFVYK